MPATTILAPRLRQNPPRLSCVLNARRQDGIAGQVPQRHPDCRESPRQQEVRQAIPNVPSLLHTKTFSMSIETSYERKVCAVCEFRAGAGYRAENAVVSWFG